MVQPPVCSRLRIVGERGTALKHGGSHVSEANRLSGGAPNASRRRSRAKPDRKCGFDDSCGAAQDLAAVPGAGDRQNEIALEAGPARPCRPGITVSCSSPSGESTGRRGWPKKPSALPPRSRPARRPRPRPTRFLKPLAWLSAAGGLTAAATLLAPRVPRSRHLRAGALRASLVRRHVAAVERLPAARVQRWRAPVRRAQTAAAGAPLRQLQLVAALPRRPRHLLRAPPVRPYRVPPGRQSQRGADVVLRRGAPPREPSPDSPSPPPMTSGRWGSARPAGRSSAP